MAANDRAAAPGKSGGSAGADGLMRASLSAVAPGTSLRDGLERVLRGNTGGLIVLGSDKTVESMCTGGFVLDVEFTATRLRELCKLDGGIVLSSDLSKILRAGVQLLPIRPFRRRRPARGTGRPTGSASRSGSPSCRSRSRCG